jgi:Domain of unknown function (DUF4440)
MVGRARTKVNAGTVQLSKFGVLGFQVNCCDGGDMIRHLAVFFLFSSLSALSQQSQSAYSCPATEQAVRAVSHQLWAASRNRDVAKLDQLLDENYFAIDDGGNRKAKLDLIAELKKPEGYIHNETDEEPADFSAVFANGVAILSYTKRWTDYAKRMGIHWGATVRITRVLACKDGRWKAVVYHETDMPNKTRPASTVELDHLNDYVGRYRIGEKGGLSVARKVMGCLRLGTTGKRLTFCPENTIRSSIVETTGSRGSFETNLAT